MTRIQQVIGRSAPFVKVLPLPIISQRSPTTSDTDYPKGQIWLDESVSPSVLYTHTGGGTWDQGGNAMATTTTAGIVLINEDGTLAGADNSDVPTSLAVKTYADALAIAGAPVATEAVAGIGELATDAEAVAGTASTPAVALLLTPSNLTPVLASPSAIGGTAAAAGTFTDLTADGTGTVSLGSNASGDFSVTGAGNDLTLDSAAGQAILTGGEAAANAVRIQADNAAGGIDIDSGTAGFIVDTTGAISLDAAAASNFTATGAFDLTLNSTAGSVNITAGESAADAIVMESTAGGVQILASGAAAGEDILVTATGSSVLVSSTEGVANAISLQASSGGIDADAAGQLNLASSQNAASAVVLTASAGGIDILATGAAAGEDIDIVATGSSVNVSSTEDAALALYLHANGGTSETIDIHSDQGTGVASVNIHSDVGGLTFTSGLASADAININASDAAGGIDVDCGSGGFIVDAAAGAVSLDSALASNFTVTGAADLTLDSSAGSVNIDGGEAAADAVSIQASNAGGGIDCDSGTLGTLLDSTGPISLDGAAASNFSVSGAGIDLTLASSGGRVVMNGEEAAANALTLLSAAGGLDADVALQMNLDSSQAAATAIVINASNAAGGIDCDSGTGGTALDSTGAISIDAAAASNFTVTGAFDLTLSSTAGSLNLSAGESANDAIVMEATAGGIDILASGAAAGEDIDIVATGSSVNITSTESAADAIVVDASGAAGAIQLKSGTGGVVLDSGLTINVVAKTNADTPYAVLGSDHYLTADTSAGVLTFTLPGAPATGRELFVYDIGGSAGANNVTLDGNGSSIAMSGTTAATKTLAANYSSAHLVYNGTLWMARYDA